MDNFDEMYDILDNSFSSNLHRGYERQKNILKYEDYKIILENNEKGEISGFLSYWDIENILFVEHFAVDKNRRGSGIGKKILNNFLKLEKNKILEVEPPNSEINKRRINFYRSFGFNLYKIKDYSPSYHSDNEKEQLYIMTQKPIAQIILKEIMKKISEDIYKR